MLSIFSCDCWPFMYLFGRNVYSHPLHNLLIGLFVFLLMGCNSSLYILGKTSLSLTLLQQIPTILSDYEISLPTLPNPFFPFKTLQQLPVTFRLKSKTLTVICKVSCDVYLVKFFIHIIFHALPYSLHSCHTGLFSSSYPGLYLLLGLYMHYSLVWNVVTLYFTCLACHSDLN